MPLQDWSRRRLLSCRMQAARRPSWPTSPLSPTRPERRAAPHAEWMPAYRLHRASCAAASARLRRSGSACEAPHLEQSPALGHAATGVAAILVPRRSRPTDSQPLQPVRARLRLRAVRPRTSSAGERSAVGRRQVGRLALDVSEGAPGGAARRSSHLRAARQLVGWRFVRIYLTPESALNQRRALHT